MDNVSNLLAPSAGATLKLLPIFSAALIAIAAAFVLYLLRCYVREWRIEHRIRRRVERARARYAALHLLISDANVEDTAGPTTSVGAP